MARRPLKPATAPPPTTATRDRILEVAARLFHEQGFAATGVATIAREADVLIGSLYHFFPGKEELLLATLQWRLTALRPVLTDPIEASADSGIDRVFALLARYRDFLAATGCRQGCPVGNLALEVSDDVAAARTLIDANFENWLDVVAGWIASARSRLPGSDARALATFVLVTMEGGIMLARARGDLRPFDDAVAQLRRHFDLLQARAKKPLRKTTR